MQNSAMSSNLNFSKVRFSLQTVFIILTILTFTGISTIVVFFDDNKPAYFHFLFMLPFSFFLCSIIFIKIYSYFFKGIGFTIFISLIFFRYTIIPLIMSLGNYKSLMINLVGNNYAPNAIILMIWELVILFAFLHFFGEKFYNNSKITSPLISNNMDKLKDMVSKKLSLKFLTIIGLFGVLSCFIVYPELQNYYFSYFFSSEEELTVWSKNATEILNGVPSFVRAFVVFWVDVVKYFIALFILLSINKKLKRSKNNFWPILFSLLVIIINMIIMTPNMAINIYISLVFLIILKTYYPKSGKRILIISSFVIGIICIYILISKSLLGGATISETNAFENLSSEFQAYFAGPTNISTAVYMTSTIDYYGLEIFIVDILKKTPIIQFFFQNINMPTSPILFNAALYGDVGKKDQIIPLIGQGYLYFGMVLAPLLSILILYISMIFDRAIIKNKNNEMLAFYLIGTIIASFSINVYNFDIFIQLMFQYVLPLYLLIKFNTKKNMSYNPVINNVSLISNQRPLNNC